MHPNIRTQFYSSSLDHTIKLWDMNDGTLLQTYQLGKPCLGILASNTERDILYVLVQDANIYVIIHIQYIRDHTYSIHT